MDQYLDRKIRIARVDAFVYRAPQDRPVATSFGIMKDRPAVFVRLEDAEGAFGWGEIFANWPAAGAEHRARLLMDDLADLLLGASVETPSALTNSLERRTHIRALQCGEWGPFRQVIAGLDIALHDLFARRAGLPMRSYLAGETRTEVPAYASALHINEAESAIDDCRAAGFTAFKVKIGFDAHADASQIHKLAGNLRGGERLFADANQAWTAEEAIAFAGRVQDCELGWLEEPIPADAPDEDWRRIAAETSIAIAGGENIAGQADFDRAIASGVYRVLQPDIAKWGGFTGCFAVARAAVAAGLVYCPHFLGGGIGLTASAHLLAAAGGPGLLEVDVNPNPLRDLFASPEVCLADGQWSVTPGPGLGIEDLPEGIERYLTYKATQSH